VKDTFPIGMLQEIETFLAIDSSRPPGLDLYEDVFSTGTFYPLQRKAELAAMIRIARSISPQVVMEIGADKGGGFYHLCKCLPAVRYAIACEVRGTPYMGLFEQTFKDIEFCWIEESSYNPDSVRYVKHWLQPGDPETIDVLFLDGDKGAYHKDFNAYLPLMSRDGIVFIHDVQDAGGPRDTFRSLSGQYHTEQILDTTDSIAALQREEQGIPANGPYEQWLREWAGRSCGVGVVYLGKKLQ
jgi:predicted O-methyltransferase YrrM